MIPTKPTAAQAATGAFGVLLVVAPAVAMLAGWWR